MDYSHARTYPSTRSSAQDHHWMMMHATDLRDSICAGQHGTTVFCGVVRNETRDRDRGLLILAGRPEAQHVDGLLAILEPGVDAHALAEELERHIQEALDANPSSIWPWVNALRATRLRHAIRALPRILADRSILITEHCCAEDVRRGYLLKNGVTPAVQAQLQQMDHSQMKQALDQVTHLEQRRMQRESDLRRQQREREERAEQAALEAERAQTRQTITEAYLQAHPEMTDDPTITHQTEKSTDQP